MDVLRTPDSQFENLPDYAYTPHYVDLGGLRMHYLDEGEPEAPTALLLHGEPSWSYLYRRMLPPLLDQGFRVLVPDLIGFGRSDKPSTVESYSYRVHLLWLRRWLDGLDLSPVHLFCQDWGGLLGLRIAGEDPDRFASIAVANTFLPTGQEPVPEAFLEWREYAHNTPDLPIGDIVARGCAREVSADIRAAYDAPFPDASYKAGARAFPNLVPIQPNDPEGQANASAWEGLVQFRRPLLTCFSDSDPITAGADRVFQKRVPGAAEQPHFTVGQAGHFLQEDAGDELGRRYADWLAGLRGS